MIDTTVQQMLQAGVSRGVLPANTTVAHGMAMATVVSHACTCSTACGGLYSCSPRKDRFG